MLNRSTVSIREMADRARESQSIEGGIEFLSGAIIESEAQLTLDVNCHSRHFAEMKWENVTPNFKPTATYELGHKMKGRFLLKGMVAVGDPDNPVYPPKPFAVLEDPRQPGPDHGYTVLIGRETVTRIAGELGVSSPYISSNG